MRRLGKVIIQEVGARDGLQNEKVLIPTARKLALINSLGRTGLSRIECTSFVSPKWVPQMGDHKEVLEQLMSSNSNSDCQYGVLVPNERGYGTFRAIADYRRAEMAIFISASEGFSLKNINKSVKESLDTVRSLVELAHKDNFRVRGYLSSVIACPYDGPQAPERIALIGKELLDLGCYEVSLGDTIGAGTLETTERMLTQVLRKINASHLAIHAHDTYGNGIANTLKAVELGVRVVDSSIAGLGGCPYAKSPTGNIATEKIVRKLHELGYETGINLNELEKVAAEAAALVGKTP